MPNTKSPNTSDNQRLADKQPLPNAKPSQNSNNSEQLSKSLLRYKKAPLPLAILLTLCLVIFIREVAVLVCDAFGFASAGNIVGMIALFLMLIVCRFTIGLPEGLTEASNKLLVDSGFAFLPVSAGAGLLIFGLGSELWGIMITMLVSTLIPLWGLAKLANHWLGGPNSGNKDGVVLTNTAQSNKASQNANASHKRH